MDTIEERQCISCSNSFPKNEDNFQVIDKKTGRLSTNCKQCRSKRSKEWRKNNPEKVKEYRKNIDREKRKVYIKKYRKDRPEVFKRKARKYFLKKAYGLTPEEYEYACLMQDNRCSICRRKSDKEPHKKLSVDHNHENGEIRGLVCHGCNMVVGYCREDVLTLQRVGLYLQDPPGIKRKQNG